MISVIIPAYNVEKYVEECLTSVLNQTYKDIEIIIVDDGSKDGTLQIIKNIAGQDDRIIIYEQENKGAGAARNFGLEKAKGEYVIFLDADDYFEPNMLEDAYNCIEADKADVCVWKSWEFDDVTREEHIIGYSIVDEYVPESNVFNWETNGRYIFNFCNGWPWDKLYRKSFVQEKNLKFQEIRTSNDTLFVMTSLAYADRICVVRNPYVHHRMNNKSSLAFTREKSWDCCFKAATAVYEVISKLDYYDNIRQSFFDCIAAFFHWHFITIGANYRQRIYNGIKECAKLYGMLDAPEEQYNVPFYRQFLQNVNDFEYSEYMLYEKITQDVNGVRRDIDECIRQNNELRHQIEMLEEERNRLNHEKEELIAATDNECKKICNSLTYKIGEVILFLPKKLVNLIMKTHY